MSRRFVVRLPANGRLPIYILLIWVLIMLWLRDVLGFPSAISYLTDVILIYAYALHMNRILRENRRAHSDTQVRIVYLILLAIVFGVIINLVNPLLVVWAARNNLRLYLFFFACIGLLELDDIDRILKIFLGFFGANVVVCTIQYFAQGLSGDQLGGFFGVVEGSNTYMNILLCIVCSVVLGRYFDNKVSVIYLVVCIAACMYIAILSELKAFYVEVILIFLAGMAIKGVSWKTFLLFGLGIFVIWSLIMILSVYDPKIIKTFLDADAMEAYLAGEGYTQSGDLNRFTAIQQIYDRFFEGKLIKTLFGFGFGNCEVSQIDIFFSDFARQYLYLHYRWFTHAWVFLEQGAIGLILLTVFFVSLLVTIRKWKQYLRQDLAIAATCFVTTCIFGMIYNCGLQLEAGYMSAFMCAIPFVCRKQQREP